MPVMNGMNRAVRKCVKTCLLIDIIKHYEGNVCILFINQNIFFVKTHIHTWSNLRFETFTNSSFTVVFQRSLS